MDGQGLYVRSSLLIGKIMVDPAPLHCFSKTKDCRFVKPENWVSKLNSHTGLGLYVGHHTQRQCPKRQNSLAKLWKFLEDPNEHLNFAVKKDVWCSIVDRIFFNIKNHFLIARVPSPIMTSIQSAWMVNSSN